MPSDAGSTCFPRYVCARAVRMNTGEVASLGIRASQTGSFLNVVCAAGHCCWALATARAARGGQAKKRRHRREMGA
jgi:hypothetical protein